MTYKDPLGHAKYMREIWYPRNKAKHMVAVRKVKRRLTEETRVIKLTKGCMDCGYNSHAEALDFDHRDKRNKQFSIGGGTGFSRAKILAEMKKCDVVCANCHRIRTKQRRVSRTVLR